MSYKNRAYVLDQSMILSTAQTLPSSGTSVDSTNTVLYGGNSAGKMKIVVKANTAVAIANGQYLTIVASYGATSSPSDTLSKTLLYRGNKTWAAGDTICEEIIPDSLPDTYKYVKLTYTTTASEAGELLDAFVVMT